MRTKKLSIVLTISLLIGLLQVPGLSAEGGLTPPFSGTPQEWAGIAHDEASAANGLQSLKAVQSGSKLHVAVMGALSDGGELYIDSDNDVVTGWNSSLWSNGGGIDYKVAGGLLHRYENGAWISGDSVNAAHESGFAEIEIELSEIGLASSGKLRVGYVQDGASMLPEIGEAMLTVDAATEDVPASDGRTIAVDGDAADWSGLVPLTMTADGSTTITANVYDQTLYMLIEGQIDTNEFADGLWEHLLIDTDRNAATGSVSWAWASSLGSDFLVQSGLLYQSGADGGWAWNDTGTVFDYVRSGTGADKVIEWSLPLDALGLSDTDSVNLAFLTNTQSAPVSNGDPATLVLKAAKVQIVTDGQADDWAEIAEGAVPSGQASKLLAVRDDRKLYTLVTGGQMNLDNDYYLDSDGDPSTGFQNGRWPDAGMDYKVSGGILHAYSNDSWEEDGAVYTNVTTELAEMYLYLGDIGASLGSEIKIGYVGRDLLQLPQAGEEALTVDSTIAHSGGEGVFYPKESFEVLNNPYIGWVPWARDGKKTAGESYAQPHSTVYAGISWRELEPRRGKFDWKGIEEKYQFDFWAQSGKRINLRIVMDLPTTDPSHMDIPDWLYESLQAESDAGVWYDTVEIGSGFSPNYNSELLLAEHERMIKAVAKRYDDDPRVAFVQLGSLGHWGEWHTWPAGSGVFPNLGISDRYVQHYLDHFTNKKIGMRKPFPIASEQHLGLFNDVFGIKSSTNEWIGWTQNGWTGIGEFVDPGDDPAEKLAASAMPDFWKYSFSGGEFAEGNPAKWLSDDAIMETLCQTRESHTSWLGPSAPSDIPLGSELQRNIDAMHKIMGYRYVLEAVQPSGTAVPGGKLDLRMLWNNKGVAPFYFDWPLELRLIDGKGRTAAHVTLEDEDIREWLPGRTEIAASFPLSKGLKAGNYALVAAIINPETGEPGIQLANEGRREDGSYWMGDIQILSRKLGR